MLLYPQQRNQDENSVTFVLFDLVQEILLVKTNINIAATIEMSTEHKSKMQLTSQYHSKWHLHTRL